MSLGSLVPVYSILEKIPLYSAFPEYFMCLDRFFYFGYQSRTFIYECKAPCVLTHMLNIDPIYLKHKVAPDLKARHVTSFSWLNF